MNTRRKIQTIALFKGVVKNYTIFLLICQDRRKKKEKV